MVLLVGLASYVPAGETRTIASAFSSTMARISVMPNASSVPVQWTYTNHWDFPLLVEKFDESCGCLSGKLDAKTTKPVAPGGTGSIKALFAAGPYRGLVRKSLHVRFVGHEGSVELIAEVRIPSTVEFSAQELTWTRGPNNETRSVEVTAGTDSPFHIISLSGVTSTQYTIVSKTLVEGRHYRLSIKPADGVDEGVKTLLVRTDSPDPRDRFKAVFLNMKPAAAGDNAATGTIPSVP